MKKPTDEEYVNHIFLGGSGSVSIGPMKPVTYLSGQTEDMPGLPGKSSAVFICQQCRMVVPNVTISGVGTTLRCHGAVEVIPKSIVEGVHECFAEPSAVAANEFNIHFVCLACSWIVKVFECQTPDESNGPRDTIFRIMCNGRVCQGRTHTLVVPNAREKFKAAAGLDSSMLVAFTPPLRSDGHARIAVMPSLGFALAAEPEKPRPLRKLRLE